MSSCQNVNDGTAYEPGSGTTIMSYSGICPPGNNVQTFTDPQYHTGSLEIFAHLRLRIGDACPDKMLTDNTEPVVEIPRGGFFYPYQHAFELIASAPTPKAMR